MAVTPIKPPTGVALSDATLRLVDPCIHEQHAPSACHGRKRPLLEAPLSTRPCVRPRCDTSLASCRAKAHLATDVGQLPPEHSHGHFSIIGSMRLRCSQQWQSHKHGSHPAAALSQQHQAPNTSAPSAPLPQRPPASNGHAALSAPTMHHPTPSPFTTSSSAPSWDLQPATPTPALFPLLPPPKPLILLSHGTTTLPNHRVPAAATPQQPHPPTLQSHTQTNSHSPRTPVCHPAHTPNQPPSPPPPRSPIPSIKLRLPSLCARAWPLSYHRARHTTTPKPPPPVDPLPPDLAVPPANVPPSAHVAWKRSRLLMGRFVVRRSGVQGLGVYTRDHLAAGELLMEYTGELVRHAVADRREVRYHAEGLGCYFFALTPELVIDATHRGGIARFVNHSCEPNCETRLMAVGGRPRVFLFALQPIAPCTELLYDYKLSAATVDQNAALEGLPTGDERLLAGTLQAAAHISCCCGAPSCRRVL